MTEGYLDSIVSNMYLVLVSYLKVPVDDSVNIEVTAMESPSSLVHKLIPISAVLYLPSDATNATLQPARELHTYYYCYLPPPSNLET